MLDEKLIYKRLCKIDPLHKNHQGYQPGVKYPYCYALLASDIFQIWNTGYSMLYSVKKVFTDHYGRSTFSESYYADIANEICRMSFIDKIIYYIFK